MTKIFLSILISLTSLHLYSQKNPNRIYDEFSGETFHGLISPAEGWRTDTLNGGYNKTIYENPYITHDKIQKTDYYDGNNFVYYMYKEGKRYTGEISVLSYLEDYIEFQGECVDGLLQGNGVFFSEYGDTIAEGSFEDGEIVGKWTYYTSNGSILSERNYVKGKAFPKTMTRYNLNSKEASEIRREYLEDYLISYEKEYRNNLLYSEKTLIESNRKNEHYRGDGSIYVYNQYDQEGEIIISGHLKSDTVFGDKRIGKWYYYDKNGEIINQEEYEDGKLK